VSHHTFILNGKRVSVDCEGTIRLLWVLRDLLGVTGPKYGCGLGVCRACTSHINGKAFNPCIVPVSHIKPTDGLNAPAGQSLHPMQQAWIDNDVAQCGYCQPGQIMTAIAVVNRAHAEGRQVSEADLDSIRDVCRCGTYPRVRQAIEAGAAAMKPLKAYSKKKKKTVKHKAHKHTHSHAHTHTHKHTADTLNT
jgi:isoquinoline 1-oxidoreductase subunit alpha